MMEIRLIVSGSGFADTQASEKKKEGAWPQNTHGPGEVVPAGRKAILHFHSS